ncbi:MAG: MoxR family ATPase [bacterium]|nr:MoxR family ATPase [bacterium]
MKDIEYVEKLVSAKKQVISELKKCIVGQDDVINQILVNLFSQGHCILLGVPGLAKTLLVNTIASALSLKFNRIQFTPDLMPSDITGTDIIEQDAVSGKRIFRFVKGPVFANIVLADEINRTPPKTQSALLQAMQEYNVTASGITYKLEHPFFVLATQNPIEQEGTYPLPEAQLDRFMCEIEVNYPTMEEECKIVETTTSQYVPVIEKVLGMEDILELQKLIRKIPVPDKLIQSVVKFVNLTRPSPEVPKYVNDWVAWGASPRASQYLILGAKACAALDGRYTPSIEDVKYMAIPVLRHRIIPNFHAEADNITTVEIIKRLLKEV